VRFFRGDDDRRKTGDGMESRREQHDSTASAIPGSFHWLRLAAVLPPLVTAAAFAIAWQQWGSTYATLMAKTIQLEFLVIHAGMFLGVFILVPVETALFRVLRWVAVILLSLMYCYGGYGLLGWHGVLTLVAIFVGTYAGFIAAHFIAGGGALPTGGRAAELGVRWFVSMLAYGLLTRPFALPELVNTWTELRASVALGAIYFTVLAMVEATPLYPLIRGEWRRPRGAARQAR